REEWLDDGPGDTEEGLFVSNLHVAPGEEVEEFPVCPELAEIESNPVLARSYRDERPLGELDGRGAVLRTGGGLPSIARDVESLVADHVHASIPPLSGSIAPRPDPRTRAPSSEASKARWCGRREALRARRPV